MHKLLPASSTESESASALSARSAPTPDIVVVNEILISPPDDVHRFPGDSEGRIISGGGGGGAESAESTAGAGGVMEESENVPAPPEFSGAGSATAVSVNDDVDQDTEGDVDDVLSSSRAKSSAELEFTRDTKQSDEEEGEEEEDEVSPLNDIPEEITTTSQDSTIKRRQGDSGRMGADDGDDEAHRSATAATVPRVSSTALSSGGGGGGGYRDDDQEVTFCAGLDRTEDILGSLVTLESPPTVFAEDGESATDAIAAPGDAVAPLNVGDDNVKIADMYVRLASSATSSTNGSSSSANTTAGATSNGVPFIGKTNEK